MGRRPLRPAVVIAVGVVFGVAGVAAGTAPVSARPVVVPFVDRPLPAVLPKRVLLPLPPIVAPSCPAADLAAEVSQSRGVGGNDYRTLQFTNTSGRQCSLVGHPRVTALRDGEPVAEVRTAPGGPYDPYPPRDLAPGDAAVLAVSTSRSCNEFQNRATVHGKDADVALFHLDGGDLAVPLDFNVACGFGVTNFGSRQAPGEIRPAMERLRVQVALPPTARPGGTMRFLASVTNPSPRPVSLDECFGYRVILRGKRVGASADLGLNCEAVPVIGAGQTVNYEVEFEVPAAAAGPVHVTVVLLPSIESDSGQLLVLGPSGVRPETGGDPFATLPTAREEAR